MAYSSEELKKRNKEYYEAHKDEIKKRSSEWRKNNKTAKNEQSKRHYKRHRKQVIERTRKYIKEHRSEMTEKGRLWREKNKESYKASRDRWRSENRIAILTHGYNRRTRLRGARGACSKEQLRWRWEFYGNACWMCGGRATVTDHVIPLSRGGSNFPSNLRPACRSCNARKSSKKPNELSGNSANIERRKIHWQIPAWL